MSIQSPGAGATALRYTAAVMESKPESSRRMMPILVGVGLVAAVLAIIALWPGDEKGRGDKRGASAAERAGRSAGAIAAAGEGEGGVKARDYDEPSAARTGARNPAIK